MAGDYARENNRFAAAAAARNASGGSADDGPPLDNTPLPRTADGGTILPSGKVVYPSVTVSETQPALDFAADTASRRGASSLQSANARAALGIATAEDLKILGQFPSTQRLDSSLAAFTPSGMTKVDKSPVTYSFNERTGQAYWNLGEDNLLREIPKAFKQLTLDEAKFADPNNAFAKGPRIGNVLTDFALYSGAGALVLPASAPVSLGFFGIGALAGGGVNYSFQRATGPDTKWGDVVNASITGGLTFGKSLVPSLAVNSFGAWTTASLQGDDATVKTLAAIGGTLLGGPVGQLAQTTTRNIAVATAIRYETPTLSLSIASSTLPANATMSSIASESVGLGTDWLNSRERRPK